MTRIELLGTAAVAVISSIVGPRYARVRIVHAPDSLASRVAFTPADVERFALATRIVSDRNRIEDIAGAVDAARPVATPGTVDVRWNVTFYDDSGAAVHHVSIDRFGRRALIDGVPANVAAADLVERLRASLNECDASPVLFVHMRREPH